MAHKYHAVPTAVDGYRFASQREARYYQNLKLLEKAGATFEICPEALESGLINAFPNEIYMPLRRKSCAIFFLLL